MNDLPLADVPPNVQHLTQTDDGSPLPAETRNVSSCSFTFYSKPFAHLLHCNPKNTESNTDSEYGLDLRDDDLLQRAYVHEVTANSPASHLFSLLNATWNKIRGAYILSINNTRIFNTEDAYTALQSIHDQGVYDDIPITFAPEGKLTAKTV